MLATAAAQRRGPSKDGPLLPQNCGGKEFKVGSFKHVTVTTLANDTDLRWTSWRLSSRPWLSRRGGGSWGQDSHLEILQIFYFLTRHNRAVIKKEFVPVRLSESASALGPLGTDTAGSAEPGGCRGFWRPTQTHRLKKKCRQQLWCLSKVCVSIVTLKAVV